MDSVRLKNYRCFRDEQSAKLAPLTLLVGDNSTGKTSFLAMIRALWDVFDSRTPNFKEEPYDLGSYDEIAHHRGGRGGRADGFEAGFSVRFGWGPKDEEIAFDVRFNRAGSAPVPVRTLTISEDAWIEDTFAPGESRKVRIGTDRGVWENEIPLELDDTYIEDERSTLLRRLPVRYYLRGRFDFDAIEDSPALMREDIDKAKNLAQARLLAFSRRPFASAPVRSKPRRTYDPARVIADPEGDYIPMYLADAYFRDKKAWARLKDGLERFGRDAGLFDEISVKALGRRGGDPFQVQVRKFGGGLKGPWRNLADMGYGVSQALPLMTELLREGADDGLFLLQQPEVHLHPSAQAALGSLFCRTAGRNRQLIVETHSDHLIDRVRMDVRDGVSDLKPSDVSILYFQRDALDVKIHSLGIDGEGNILNAPNDYRHFFMEETKRSLWGM